MKITSTKTVQFQARVRVLLKRKIRVMLGDSYENCYFRDMPTKQLEYFFNKFKYGK